MINWLKDNWRYVLLIVVFTVVMTIYIGWLYGSPCEHLRHYLTIAQMRADCVLR